MFVRLYSIIHTKILYDGRHNGGATSDRCPPCVDCHLLSRSCWEDTGHLFRSRGVRRMWQGESITRKRPIGTRPPILADTGVDRWGTGGTCPSHFSEWGDSIRIVPPLFSSEKLRGIWPDSTLLSLKSCYIGLARQ